MTTNMSSTEIYFGGDTINEAGGGTDTLDFSSTTTRRIAIDLSQSTLQVVNLRLTLTLNSATTIENVIGGSLADTFTGETHWLMSLLVEQVTMFICLIRTCHLGATRSMKPVEARIC